MTPPSRPRRATALGLFAALALVATSCSDGPPVYPVTGKVLVDGKPAVGAMVIFFPEGDDSPAALVPSGTVGEDGTFTLGTGTRTGAPAGRYIVAVSWPDPSVKATDSQKMMGMSPDAPDLLAGTYSRARSTIRADVTTGDNNLEPYQLKAPAPPDAAE